MSAQGRGKAQRALDRLQAPCVARRWDILRDEVGRRVLKCARGAVVSCANDDTARRIGGCIRNPKQLERETVGENHVTVMTADGDGVLRRYTIDEFARRERV